MKKTVFGLMVAFILWIGVMVGSSDAQTSSIHIQVDGKQVHFTNETGYPFVDASGRTQVPFRVALEAFGAEVKWDENKQQPYATYNGVEVYAPINQSYIYINGKPVKNDTTALIRDGRTYCPIRKVLEAFGMSIAWDAASNTVIASPGQASSLADSEETYVSRKRDIPHPKMVSAYSTSKGTGKYAGYQILHGHPQEKDYVVYFTHANEGGITSTSIAYDLKKPENMNERIKWSYDGVTYTSTRKQLYTYFSDTSEIVSFLSNQGAFSEQWFYDTFGQVYVDWIDKLGLLNYAEKHVNAYLNNEVMPDAVSFRIYNEDWVSATDLDEYNLELNEYPRGYEYPYLQWLDLDVGISVIHPLPDYYNFYDYPNGYMEFNQIRVMSDSRGNLFFYRKDLEDHIIRYVAEEFNEMERVNEAWLTHKELKAIYGVSSGIYEGFHFTEYPYFYTVENRFKFYEVVGYRYDFTGEQVFNQVRMKKDKSGSILINKEDFEKFVLPMLEIRKKEADAFNQKWISEADLTDAGIDLMEYPVEDEVKKIITHWEYMISGNRTRILLNGLLASDKKEGTTAEFSGIEVYFLNDTMYFNREDLREKGFLAE
ncbi:copper amine oxidase N-terminal domain-containing protein [Marinicrinis sediminis]|uniref:Copper amine oxidase N-terminal domain-containing protein n=1 Tax=Marinicrinis sediminis TaxID=1652465 RepID=A0ABW5R5Z2_9BACL